MIYGYSRVSTKGQEQSGNSLEAQQQQLRQAGAQTVYADSFTGTKASRPQLDALLAQLESGDTLVVTKLDRIARSLTQGVELVTRLLEKDVRVHILNIGVLDNTPSSRLIRNIFFAFAEFERDMIMERTREGKAIARQNPSFREGRPPVYSKTQKDHALSLLDTHSYKQVEAMTGISKSTLIRARRKAKDESQA